MGSLRKRYFLIAAFLAASIALPRSSGAQEWGSDASSGNASSGNAKAASQNVPQSGGPPGRITDFTGPEDGYSANTIEVGDKLNIQVYREEELSRTFMVDENGGINYPLLGDVHVEGLTPQELKDYLTQELGRDYLVDPQIQVTYVQSSGKSVSVLGEVAAPGNYFYVPGSTLTRLISQVGGFRDTASLTNIRVVRMDKDRKKMVLTVDMNRIVSGEEDDFALEPADVIYVDRLPKGEGMTTAAGDEIDPTKIVTVMGQISQPGNYPWSEELTLLRAIAQAGDFTPTAATHNVRIVRRDENGKEKVLIVNAGKILDGRATDVPLSKGDLIVVRESFF